MFMSIGLFFVGLCMFVVFNSYKQKSTHDKEMAMQTAVSFVHLLSNGDSISAFKYVWSGEQLHIRSYETAQAFKDSKILEVIKIDYDSAKNRPEYYQQFHKIILLMIKIKQVHEDNAGNPPGNYILFITVVQKTPESNWLVAELGSGP